jgi:hypothetical protein
VGAFKLTTLHKKSMFLGNFCAKLAYNKHLYIKNALYPLGKI